MAACIALFQPTMTEMTEQRIRGCKCWKFEEGDLLLEVGNDFFQLHPAGMRLNATASPALRLRPTINRPGDLNQPRGIIYQPLSSRFMTQPPEFAPACSSELHRPLKAVRLPASLPSTWTRRWSTSSASTRSPTRSATRPPRSPHHRRGDARRDHRLQGQPAPARGAAGGVPVSALERSGPSGCALNPGAETLSCICQAAGLKIVLVWRRHLFTDRLARSAADRPRPQQHLEVDGRRTPHRPGGRPGLGRHLRQRRNAAPCSEVASPARHRTRTSGIAVGDGANGFCR